MCSREHLLAGSTAASLQDYDSAVSHFTQGLLAVSGECYDTLVQKARALTHLNNFLSAIEDSERAIALAPTRPEAYLALGIAKFRAGSVSAANIEFATAIEKSTTNAGLQAIAQCWQRKAVAELGNKNFRDLSIAAVKPQAPKVAPAAVVIPTIEVLNTSGRIAYTWF